MAESLLFALAESFIGKIASRAVEESSLALGVYDDLQDIKNTVSLIKAVLLDSEQKQLKNHELQEWLRQIKRIFNNAEDVIDDFECEALRKHVVNTSGSIGRKVRRYYSSSNPLVYRLKMAHQIKHIKERFNKVAADRHNFGLTINENDNRVVQRREMTHSQVKVSEVIGRDHDKQKIIDLLLLDGGDTSLSIIPIVGIGGLGKTILAKYVFNDNSVVESFPLKMWVCVSDDFELKHVLVKILNSSSAFDPNQIHQEIFKNFDVEQLQNHMRNTLDGQKFLLVLDDVWNEDRVKWEELKDILQGVAGAEGSKVLVTTRSHTVANMMGTSASHTLQCLSIEDSLSIFVKWAFKEGEVKNYPELKEIGKEIVKKCGGLPLALRTLGSSLFLKFDIEDWKFVRDNEIWNLPQKEGDILPAIKLSYDQLPSYLKRCFACFSLFRKDFQFDNFSVTMLWHAHGFLPSPKKGETVDDVSNQLLHDLSSRSFLQDFHDLDCENLDELPKWLSTLICLKTIEISNCPKLLSLPDDMHRLTNLEYLNIEDYYVQPAVEYIESDIVEGESRISLNCPISFTRIKTPVKGHSCKHFQCFDIDNFFEINYRKPFQTSFPTKADFRAGIDLKAEGHNQFLSPRHIHRTPVVVLALPVQSQILVVGPHPHNSVTNFDSLVTTSAAASAYPHNAILSDNNFFLNCR
ncbi:hypothetical protein TSUD_24320 [Trifolium subterraneum]|uniref:SP-RING-type domain-containing protein n=1 Tax=Trifolium subterraneum TaxID=3900 RepID=A0A2Z6NN04_TRISU|nr:hypothetical protein TSUD_24320 [Trifolium subterraneum]